MNIFPGKIKTIPKAPYALLCGIWLVLFVIYLHYYYYKWPTYKYEVHPTKKLNYDLAIKANDPELIFVEIPKDLELYKNKKVLLNGQEIELTRLTEQIKQRFIYRSKDRQVVYIKSIKEINYGYFIEVVDVVKSTGASSIQIQIDHLDESLD